MPPQQDKAFTLDKTTLIPIGLLVAVVLSAISATIWINTYLLNLQHEVNSLRVEVEKLNKGTWSLTDMQVWVNLANSQKAFPLPSPSQLNR